MATATESKDKVPTREIYCVKCKVKRVHSFEKGSDQKKKGKYMRVTASNGRKMAKGACPVCGTRTSVFLPN